MTTAAGLARPELVLPAPASAANLRDQVLDAIRHSGGPEPRIDEDGDVVLRFRDVPVYLRINDDAAEVHIFSPALVGLGSPSGIYRTLNEINRKFKFSKAILDGDQVIVRQSVQVDPFAEPALISALYSVSITADFCAKDLQARYGGTVIFGRSLPPKDASRWGYL